MKLLVVVIAALYFIGCARLIYDKHYMATISDESYDSGVWLCRRDPSHPKDAVLMCVEAIERLRSPVTEL